jgi:hypothetical protein
MSGCVAQAIALVGVGVLIPATVVLVHGNFLGPSSWRDVTEILASAQVSAKAIRLPSSTTDGSGPCGDLYDDAAQVRAVLDELRGPVVLCGHSYGGAVQPCGWHPTAPGGRLAHDPRDLRPGHGRPHAGTGFADLPLQVDRAYRATHWSLPKLEPTRPSRRAPPRPSNHDRIEHS